jgi:tripartite-type tricarboxylate transporter receptor subunit TctC
VVPFGPGGGTDIYARIIKKAIDDNKLLPAPLVIINRGGAGATIGSRYVKDAQADGYTVLLLHDAILTAQATGSVTYGPEAFEPVAGTSEVGMVICVREDARWKNLDELMDEVEQHPDMIRFGANLGALTHYAGLMLEKERPGALFRFAQSGGGADRSADLIGGHTDVTGFSFEEFVRFEPQGVRGLAYLSAERHPVTPNLPTAREQGLDIVNTNTFYWWFPKGTPPERVQVFADALEKALKTDYIQQKMDELRFETLFLTGPELEARITNSAKQYAGVEPREVVSLPNLPLILSLCTLAMGGVVVVRAWQSGGGLLPRETTEAVTNTRSRWRLAVAAMTLTFAYAAVLNLGWCSYGFVTFAYLLLLAGLLGTWSWRRLAVALVISAGSAVLLWLLFAVVLGAPLP